MAVVIRSAVNGPDSSRVLPAYRSTIPKDKDGTLPNHLILIITILITHTFKCN